MILNDNRLHELLKQRVPNAIMLAQSVFTEANLLNELDTYSSQILLCCLNPKVFTAPRLKIMLLKADWAESVPERGSIVLKNHQAPLFVQQIL